MKNRKNKFGISALVMLCGAVPFYARYQAGAAGGAAGAVADPPEPGDKGAGGGGDPPVTGKGSDDPAVLKAKADELLKETLRRKSENNELRLQMKDLESRALSAEELERYRQYQTDQQTAEEERARKNGEFDRLLAETKTKAKTELETVQRERDAAVSNWQNERITNAIALEVPKHVGAGIPVSDVMLFVRPFVSISKDGEFVVRVNGKEVMDPETGKEVDLPRFVELEIAKRDYIARHKPTGGSGSAAGAGGPGSRTAEGKKIWTRSEIRGLSNAEYAKNNADILAAQAEGRVRDG